MHKQKYLLVFLLMLSFNLSAQPTFKKIMSVSRPEKWWAVTHPFAALKAFKISNEATATALSVMADTILDKRWNGGKADAFRHSYWMALLARELGQKRAWSLGKAHEKGNWLDFKKGRLEDGEQPDSLSSVMDFYNNNVGINLGLDNCHLTKEQLKDVVISWVLAGNMLIIMQNAAGDYIDCEGNVIDTQAWKDRWHVPKCITSSGNKENMGVPP